MTVKELKNKLQMFPDSMEVFIEQTDDEFKVVSVNSCLEVEVSFYDDSDCLDANEKVVVLTDD